MQSVHIIDNFATRTRPENMKQSRPGQAPIETWPPELLNARAREAATYIADRVQLSGKFYPDEPLVRRAIKAGLPDLWDKVPGDDQIYFVHQVWQNLGGLDLAARKS